VIEYVGPIEKQTLNNTYFRQVLFTAPHSQLVVMCLQPGEAIGNEVHPKVDQFFHIERGGGKFIFNEKDEHWVHEGDAVVVPAGTFHNVINTSKRALLKLYTIYSPPKHPPGTVHKTKAEAEVAEAAEHDDTQSRRPAGSRAEADARRRAMAQPGLRRRSEWQ
jgi:mannose-6-phosphate isomerase-like protein (cupin superfamily)